ncbi:transcription elongation factor GreA [Candidatus Bealeia paramacronuclearis]
MEKAPMTANGLQRLQDELHYLKSVERHAVIKAIADAREHGDLSENAEYHAAKDKQGFIEGRIQVLEDKISRAQVIDVASLSGQDVKFGATVKMVDDETGEEITYQIVGVDEADLKLGLISNTSPLARAIIGKSVGDTCEVSTPGRGMRSYEILEVVYK